MRFTTWLTQGLMQERRAHLDLQLLGLPRCGLHVVAPRGQQQPLRPVQHVCWHGHGRLYTGCDGHGRRSSSTATAARDGARQADGILVQLAQVALQPTANDNFTDSEQRGPTTSEIPWLECFEELVVAAGTAMGGVIY